MKRSIVMLMSVLALVVSGTALVSAQIPPSMQEALDLFNEMYGTAGTPVGVCTPCHASTTFPIGLNPYGTAFVQAGGNPLATGQQAANRNAYVTIQPLDSDGDGFSNIAEINSRTLPGVASSVPLAATTGLMPRPVSGQQIIGTVAGASPIVQVDPVKAVPFGFGSVMTGGNLFRVQVTTPAFNGPVDAFLGILAPTVGGLEIFLLTPAGLQPLSQAGLTPWIANTTAAIDQALIPDAPVSLLPPGEYTFFLALTPAGSLSSFYLWQAELTVGTVIDVTLSGSQEVPPVQTAGTGTAALAVNFDTGALAGTVTFSGLTSNALAAHFHRAPAGTNGAIFLDVLEGGLGATSGMMRVRGGTVLTAEQITALRNNELYINIHTVSNAGGEIRGQVIFPTVVPINIALSGAQEVPPVVTQGSGIANLSLGIANRELSGTVTFSGLTSNALAAHFHRAAAGANGPVFLNIIEGGLGATSGTMTVTPTVLSNDAYTALVNDELYLNIHSANNASGEIRGQVFYPSGAVRPVTPSPALVQMTVPISGAQEVPPVAPAGSGTANLVFDPATSTLSGTITFTGLTSNTLAAHFHRAPAGTNGVVFLNIIQGGLGVTVGTMTVPPTVLAADAAAALQNDELYINIHTVNNPGGEIRGQVIFP